MTQEILDKLNKIEAKLELLDTKVDNVQVAQAIYGENHRSIKEDLIEVTLTKSRIDRLENTLAYAKGSLAIIVSMLGFIGSYFLYK